MVSLSPHNRFLIFLALIFIVISSPATYKLTSKILGVVKIRTADAAGTPTNLGLITHAAVLVALTHLFLNVA